MEIKTKYNIGDRVWVLYDNDGEVCISVDYIEKIVIGDGRIFYTTHNTADEYIEEDIFSYDYEDGATLVKRIKELLENC